MPQGIPGPRLVFTPYADTWLRAALLGMAALVAFALFWWWVWPRTDWVRRTDFVLPQPVPFSHEHHVAGLGINCLMCHNTVLAGAQAGLPPTHTCMTCHSQIWTNADAARAGAAKLRRQHSRSIGTASTTCRTTSTSTTASTSPRASAASPATARWTGCR